MSVPFLSSLIGWLRDICSGAQRRVREFFLAEPFLLSGENHSIMGWKLGREGDFRGEEAL